jgi:transcriptional regulator GlxA family with amidase domain
VESKDKQPVVGVLLFNQIEVLDFAGPYEVFAAARDQSERTFFRVLTVAEQREVTCFGGLQVMANATFADCPELDILIVPGGPGARTPERQAGMIRFVQDQSQRVALIASVCTGAFILARAGLLNGRKATTHSGRIDTFRAEFPEVTAVVAKLVDEGTVITAAGVSSGIDLALYLLERWFGPSAREREARRLEGPWT